MPLALADVIRWMPYMLCVLVRVSALLASLPAPFGTGSPMQVRGGLAVLISIALAAGLVPQAAPIPLDPVAIVSAAVGELAIGAVIGLAARATIASAEVAGNAVGLSIGQGFAGSIDPSFGEQALPTGRIASSLGALIFFAMQGHHVALRALRESLAQAPPGHALGGVMHEGVFRVGAELIGMGLRIASPVVASMLLVQVGLALVSRAAPRVQIFALSFAVTSSVGLVILYAAAPSMTLAIEQSIAGLPEALGQALGAP